MMDAEKKFTVHRFPFTDGQGGAKPCPCRPLSGKKRFFLCACPVKCTTYFSGAYLATLRCKLA